MRRTVIGVAALTGLMTAISGASLATAAPVGSDARGERVVADGLKSAYGLDTLGRRSLVVADSSAGKVIAIGRRGGKRTLVSGALGVAGVTTSGNKLYSVLGGGDETGAIPPGGKYKPTSVLRTNLRTGKTRVLANLLAYEKKNNPDGQVQDYPTTPPDEPDALSNPFAITTYPGGLLVADGGANDVLRVNPRTGRVSTFFVPPNVQASGCVQANPGSTGCDPVPTGVTYAKGSVWVSTLGAETPGAGRIYKLNARTGKVKRFWKGLDAPTGVAVAKRAIYFSQVLANFTSPPGTPGFDPEKIGQISRIGKRGRLTVAKVTLPVGLALRNGKLFSTAWSVAADFGIPHDAEVVRVYGAQFK